MTKLTKISLANHITQFLYCCRIWTLWKSRCYWHFWKKSSDFFLGGPIRWRVDGKKYQKMTPGWLIFGCLQETIMVFSLRSIREEINKMLYICLTRTWLLMDWEWMNKCWQGDLSLTLWPGFGDPLAADTLTVSDTGEKEVYQRETGMISDCGWHNRLESIIHWWWCW